MTHRAPFQPLPFCDSVIMERKLVFAKSPESCWEGKLSKQAIPSAQQNLSRASQSNFSGDAHVRTPQTPATVKKNILIYWKSAQAESLTWSSVSSSRFKKLIVEVWIMVQPRKTKALLSV